MVVLFSSLLRFYGLSGGFQCSLGSGTKPTQTLSSPGGTQTTAAQLPVTPSSPDSGSTTTRRKTTTRDSTAKRIAAQQSAKVTALKEEIIARESSTLSGVNWTKISKLGIRQVPVQEVTLARTKAILDDFVSKLKSADRDSMDVDEASPTPELYQAESRWRAIAADTLNFYKTWIKNGDPNPEEYARNFIDHYLKQLMNYPADRIRFFQGYTVSSGKPMSKSLSVGAEQTQRNSQGTENLDNATQDSALHSHICVSTGHADSSNFCMEGVEKCDDADSDSDESDDEEDEEDDERKNQPVVLTHNGHSIALKGHVDYAVYRVRNAHEMIFNGTVSGKSRCSLHDTSEILKLRSNPDILFFPIEAKRLKGRLESQLPQVLAEALVIMKKTERKITAWCLSNGCEWIFGISQMRVRLGGRLDASYKAITIEPLWDKKTGLFDAANPGGATEGLALARLARQTETVWWLLNLWAFVPPEELDESF